ncbi:MAG: N-acetyltransferase family protein [Phascolarctobacterium sp.]|nr:N-acetyltransferase family protein [Phascolarctobacterium sp.]
MGNYLIRQANVADAVALLEIYRPFVLETSISFEYIVPSFEEFSQRIRSISTDYPYILCEKEGIPVGYAYAHRYLEREAYKWDVETTIYIVPAAQGKGLGRILYTVLEEFLTLQHMKNLYACITANNEGSIEFHKSLGYTTLGIFPRSGFKNGRWESIVWMGKSLGGFKNTPLLPVKFSNLSIEVKTEILDRINSKLIV